MTFSIFCIAIEVQGYQTGLRFGLPDRSPTALSGFRLQAGRLVDSPSSCHRIIVCSVM